MSTEHNKAASPAPLKSLWAAKLTWGSNISTSTEYYPGHQSCVEIARLAETEGQRSMIDWATEIAPWNSIIEFGI